MSGRYHSYPEYKSSGVRFFNYIPQHWAISKVRFISSFGRGLAITKANLKNKGIPCVSYGEVHSKFGFEVDPKIHNLKCVDEVYLKVSPDALLSKGDFVFADTSEDIDGSGNFTQLVSDEALFAGYHTVVVRPTSDNYYRFLAYIFDSPEYRTQVRDAVKGVKVFSVTQAILKNTHVWLPTYEEQQKIANFLDHETAKIDSLISKQEKLIELLKEKRQAVISHAVTRGLNPNAPMKGSGVEWLGEVPEHWTICEIKFVLKSLDFRRIPLSGEERSHRSGEYRYYGASGVIDHIDDYIFDKPTVLVGEDGANLISRRTPLAFAAHGKYWVNNHAHILKPKDGLADYWAEVIENINIEPLISGSAQPKFTAEALNNLKIAFPESVEERLSIENHIKEQKEKFDLLMFKANSSISLMKERKTALISAAVTGKIDVRNYNAEKAGN